MRGIERLLEWADWLVAAPLALYAVGALGLGTLVLCVASDATVPFGSWQICGR